MLLLLCIACIVYYENLRETGTLDLETLTAAVSSNNNNNLTIGRSSHVGTPSQPPQSPLPPSEAPSSSLKSENHPLSIDPDGCGLEDHVEPRWIPQSQQDTLELKQLQTCKTKLVAAFESGDQEDIINKRADLTKLDCLLKDVPVEILYNYKTIYMIGDSLLRQQFMVLLCMLNPLVEPEDVAFLNTKEKVEYRVEVQHPGNTTTTTMPTTLIYTPFGIVFPRPSQYQPLFENEFPAAAANGTQQDLIVMNAGHHYTSEMASSLQRHCKFIVQQMADRPIHFYFMETTDEQWPTSNGMYPAFGDECCCDKCACEVVTPGKVKGHGALDLFTHNWTKAFGRLRPDVNTLDPLFDEHHLLNHSTCVPDCYPANWKNELVRPILANHSNIHIVPTWRQLVARDMLHNVASHDCTHKTVDALWEINKQFLRTVLGKVEAISDA